MFLPGKRIGRRLCVCGSVLFGGGGRQRERNAGKGGVCGGGYDMYC